MNITKSFSVGLPCMKLSLNPSNQKHNGKAAKTCSVVSAWEEMSDKRRGKDKSIDKNLTENNVWAIDCLIDMGFEYDCSVFPSYHDCGGMPNFGTAEPVLLKTTSGKMIKEFPINIHKFLGKNFVFSGGGFFRFFPYWVIRKWGRKADYMMSYFHPRDFDTGQPVVQSLPLKRKFKSYVGIKGNFRKWQRFISDFELYNIAEADKRIDWNNQRVISL